MKKYIVENWEQYEDYDKLYGVDVYRPRHLGDDVLVGVVAYLQFLLNANLDDIKFNDDQLVLKKTTLLISTYIKGLDPYDEKSVIQFKEQIINYFKRYLLSCQYEINCRVELNYINSNVIV